MKQLFSSQFNTSLGNMIAVGDEQSLYLIDFIDACHTKRNLQRLKIQANIVNGKTTPIDSIEEEIYAYFSSSLKNFQTPLVYSGTPFQKQVWDKLREISFGERKSYRAIAEAIGKPKAFRAVAQAIGFNRHTIVIACHRVINTDGKLGGYAGGLERKKWLLAHEALSCSGC